MPGTLAEVVSVPKASKDSRLPLPQRLGSGDNEWGYSNRVVDLVKYIVSKGL